MRNGRMSCAEARELSMTKIFSFFNSSMAGSLSGKFNGIFLYVFLICSCKVTKIPPKSPRF